VTEPLELAVPLPEDEAPFGAVTVIVTLAPETGVPVALLVTVTVMYAHEFCE
jgi:hypothetical protein